MTDLVVIGAGIAGLAAAHEAMARGADVVVLEAAPAAGGKLRISPVAGVLIDESADTFLARRPEAIDLCRELGLGAELVAPATSRAYLWSDGSLRPLPPDQLLGIPTDLDRLADSGIISPDGVARAAQDLTAEQPPIRSTGEHADEAVGTLVRRHLGDEVFEQLVAPLIGGIWAGDSDRLSVEVAAPAIAQAARSAPSLIQGARTVKAAAGATPDTPVFLAPRGGMYRLVQAMTDKLGDRLRTATPVEVVVPTGGTDGRWRIEPAGVTTDAVVVATPAWAGAELLAPISPGAAADLAGIDYASVALVTLAVPRDGIDHPLDGSGFLVPAAAGLMLTACSWASSKWEHLAGDGSTVLLRASAGRDGDDRALGLDDAALVQAILTDLGTTMGLRADPLDVRINRWPRGLPQPRPGHLALVERIEATVAADAAGLAVAGAWSRGVGIPACIASGRTAAASVLATA